MQPVQLHIRTLLQSPHSIILCKFFNIFFGKSDQNLCFVFFPALLMYIQYVYHTQPPQSYASSMTSPRVYEPASQALGDVLDAAYFSYGRGGKEMSHFRKQPIFGPPPTVPWIFHVCP